MFYPCFHPSFHPFFFLAHVHRSNAWTDIDGWWLKRRVLTQGSAFWVCEWWKNTLRGSSTPKTVAFFDLVGKSQPKLQWSITFKTVQFGHLLIMYDKQEIMPNLSESAKTFSPQCPLTEIFELVFRCPMLRTAVQCKIGCETDWNINMTTRKV